MRKEKFIKKGGEAIEVAEAEAAVVTVSGVAEPEPKDSIVSGFGWNNQEHSYADRNRVGEEITECEYVLVAPSKDEKKVAIKFIVEEFDHKYRNSEECEKPSNALKIKEGVEGNIKKMTIDKSSGNGCIIL